MHKPAGKRGRWAFFFRLPKRRRGCAEAVSFVTYLVFSLYLFLVIEGIARQVRQSQSTANKTPPKARLDCGLRGESAQWGGKCADWTGLELHVIFAIRETKNHAASLRCTVTGATESGKECEKLWAKYYTLAPEQRRQPAVRYSQESLRVLAGRYGINPKTVTKWRKREATRDPAMGPKLAKSTVLNVGEEAMIVAFRKHTLLPP